jgi:hypothetical protein
MEKSMVASLRMSLFLSFCDQTYRGAQGPANGFEVSPAPARAEPAHDVFVNRKR